MIRTVNDEHMNNIYTPPVELLLKMKDIGFPARILKTVRSYLQNRRLQPLVSGSGSSAKRMESGVTQGTVLAPLLFTTYIR
ncbi:hypothetical protein Trydic_g22465 [Trypoxylus dichotomus]